MVEKKREICILEIMVIDQGLFLPSIFNLLEVLSYYLVFLSVNDGIFHVTGKFMQSQKYVLEQSVKISLMTGKKLSGTHKILPGDCCQNYHQRSYNRKICHVRELYTLLTRSTARTFPYFFLRSKKWRSTTRGWKIQITKNSAKQV